MKFTVLCNEEVIGEVELGPGQAHQSAALTAFPAFEQIRSILAEDADARYAEAQRIAESMPEALFAKVAKGLAGNGVMLRPVSPEQLNAGHPEFAALVRESRSRSSASKLSSLRFTLAGAHRDALAGAAQVLVWMPPRGVRSAGVPPQVIVFVKV